MKKLGLILPLILIFAAFVKADVAPDPGRTFVTNALSIEAEDDFPEYRFFLQSPIDLEEVQIKKGEKVRFSEGRGGAKNYVTLIAVPKKDLPDQNLEELNKSIHTNKINGIIKLASHSFRREVPLSYKNSPFSTDYKLTKDVKKGISITKISGSGSSGGAIDFSIYGISKGLTPLGYIVLVSFPTTAIVILGIWLFRRRKLG